MLLFSGWRGRYLGSNDLARPLDGLVNAAADIIPSYANHIARKLFGRRSLPEETYEFWFES